MSKRDHNKLLGAVCVGVRSGIIVALYLAAVLGALQLGAFLPEPWSAVGITAVLLVADLRLSGKWPGRAFRLESVGLGYQPDGQPNPQLVAPVSPKDVPARSRPALDVILDSR